MVNKTTSNSLRFAFLGALAFAYFVAFPDDLPSLLAPVERILGLTKAISPWLYVVLGGGLVAWAIRHVFVRAPQAP